MRYFMYAALVLLISCRNSAIKQKLSGADSLVIQYYIPGTDSVSKTINTTQKTAINKLIGFTNGGQAEEYKCGYDGNLIFYKNGQTILPVVFKYLDKNCRHFLMEIDGKLTSTKLSSEASDFFTSLDQGKTYY